MPPNASPRAWEVVPLPAQSSNPIGVCVSDPENMDILVDYEAYCRALRLQLEETNQYFKVEEVYGTSMQVPTVPTAPVTLTGPQSKTRWQWIKDEASVK